MKKKKEKRMPPSQRSKNMMQRYRRSAKRKLNKASFSKWPEPTPGPDQHQYVHHRNNTTGTFSTAHCRYHPT